jgi:uncharacterized delta-60 repeat protein/uncharacterized repeat protein (TIGR01451 family)
MIQMINIINRFGQLHCVSPARCNQRANTRRLKIARQALAVAIAALLMSSNLLNRAQAAAGDLDFTFDNDGRVTTVFPGDAEISDVVLQSDGRIVVAGMANIDPSSNEGYDFALARYNPDGSLDSTFGTGGIVTTDFFGFTDGASAVAIQADGKIVAAGQASIAPSNPEVYCDFALARYNPDGNLDSTFGVGGKVTLDKQLFDQFRSVAIQSSGKIVAASYLSSTNTKSDFALFRFDANGNLDPAFGASGIVITDISGGFDEAHVVAIQADDRILVAGWAYFGPFAADFALARYNPDGSLDSTFGVGGKVSTDLGYNDWAFDLALQADGRIVAAGSTYLTSPDMSDFALVRYKSDGSLDTTFGVGGKVITDFFGTTNRGGSVSVQGDGHIVMAGTVEVGNQNDFALARYNPDGSLDSTFGAGGIVTTDFFGTYDVAEGLCIQADGKIIAVGFASDNFFTNAFALARYYSDQSADLTVAKSGSPNPVIAGQEITYTITLINNGPDAAANVTLSDPTPPGTTFQSLASPPGWSCTTPPVGKTGTVTCSIASLAPAQPAIFTLVVQVSPLVPDGSRVDNRVMVSSATADPNSLDNHFTATTSVIGFSASIQDDDTGDTLQFNSRTGSYLFTRCGAHGFSLSGTGTIRMDICNISLTDSTREHTVNAALNTCTSNGQAYLTLDSPPRSFTVNDRNISDNSCACR